MKKLLLLMMGAAICMGAQSVEVSARYFKAQEKSSQALLQGDVVLKSEQSVLKCDKLVMFYDKNKKPYKYEASKNLSFDINQKSAHYQGVANKLVYTVSDDKYIMSGDVYIKDVNTKKDIKAEQIVFDAKSGDYTISGKNKQEPIILKFELGK